MSSKGAVTLAFRGYSVTVYINVGRIGPGVDREAEAFRNAQLKATHAIQAAAPTLQRIYDHYADADHPYRRHRSMLDRERDQIVPSDRGEALRLPGHHGFGFKLFVRPGTPPVLADKVLADFQLSQLAGGPLRPHLEAAREDRSRVDGPLVQRLVQDLEILDALKLAFARERDLRALARKGPPLPRLRALLLTSAIDRAPVPETAFDLLKEFPDKEAAPPAAAILRFLPDAQWDEALARLRPFLGTLEGLG